MSEIATLIETPDEVLTAEVKKIAELAQKVEGAAAFIKAAHPKEASIFKVHHHGRSADQGTWYTFLAKSCMISARDIIAVVERSAAEGSAIEAEHAAFELLSELTPAPASLTHLLRAD